MKYVFKGRFQKIECCDSWIKAFRLCPWAREVIPAGVGVYYCFENCDDACAFIDCQKGKKEVVL